MSNTLNRARSLAVIREEHLQSQNIVNLLAFHACYIVVFVAAQLPVEFSIVLVLLYMLAILTLLASHLFPEHFERSVLCEVVYRGSMCH